MWFQPHCMKLTWHVSATTFNFSSMLYSNCALKMCLIYSPLKINVSYLEWFGIGFDNLSCKNWWFIDLIPIQSFAIVFIKTYDITFSVIICTFNFIFNFKPFHFTYNLFSTWCCCLTSARHGVVVVVVSIPVKKYC